MSRDNNIVIFYEHRKSKAIHVRIQPAGEKLQVTDRPATYADRSRYPKQWEAFEKSKDQVKNIGTPLAKLFTQEPSLVKQLTAENIPTVEHLANLGDPGIETIAPLGGIELVQRANQFLEQKPVADLQAENEVLRAEIAALQQQLEQQLEMQQQPEPRRRRRERVILQENEQTD